MSDNSSLPILISKALIDAGYDLIEPDADGWFCARVSGEQVLVAVQPTVQGTLLAAPEVGIAHRVGLLSATQTPPIGMSSVGLAGSAGQLYDALRVLHSLQRHPAAALSAALEARLAAIPVTERTREVRQRIGQDLFRDALMELWEGRCSLSSVKLPPALLRASHIKPWSQASDDERLDPFNGLLLAVHYDALFDQGLITFAHDGAMLLARSVTSEISAFMRLEDQRRLSKVLPGQQPYLEYHRARIFQR